MIAGLEETSGGDIFIAGKRVNDLPPKDRDVAMVFQNYALYPHLTVSENIAFPLSIRKEKKDVIDREVRKAAELLSISHLLQRKPKELSGGERQRVAVGRAIVRKPQIFLFDEPLSNLDAALRTEMRAELKSLQRQLGTTMVYVTHDQTEAMTMGDKIVVLNNGLIEQFGSPQEIYVRPNSTFVARFLGSPAMNLIRGELTRVNGEVVFIAYQFQLELSSRQSVSKKDVLLGIRPEFFSVAREAGNKSDIKGLVTLTERLGSATNYYIDSTLSYDGRLTANVQGSSNPKQFDIGEEIVFRLLHSDMHLFDPETGLRIV